MPLYLWVSTLSRFVRKQPWLTASLSSFLDPVWCAVRDPQGLHATSGVARDESTDILNEARWMPVTASRAHGLGTLSVFVLTIGNHRARYCRTMLVHVRRMEVGAKTRCSSKRLKISPSIPAAKGVTSYLFRILGFDAREGVRTCGLSLVLAMGAIPSGMIRLSSSVYTVLLNWAFSSFIGYEETIQEKKNCCYSQSRAYALRCTTPPSSRFPAAPTSPRA